MITYVQLFTQYLNHGKDLGNINAEISTLLIIFQFLHFKHLYILETLKLITN